MATTGNVDIIAALASYVAADMGQSLLSATGAVQVYTDFAPEANPDGSPVVQPYCVVTDGPEVYNAQADHPSTGYYLSNIADGRAMVAFYATTKAEARSLGRTAVRRITDTQVQLDALDGRVVTVLPERIDSHPHFGLGVEGQPTGFIRVLTVRYMQQFLE